MFLSCFSENAVDVNKLKSAATNGDNSEPWSDSFIRFSSVDGNSSNIPSNQPQRPSSILRRASFNHSNYQVGWVLNSECNSCLCCENQFSLLRRRHHCRMCGDIVCDDCSRFRAVVKGLGPVPQRICIECQQNMIQNKIDEDDSHNISNNLLSRNNDYNDEEDDIPPPLPSIKTNEINEDDSLNLNTQSQSDVPISIEQEDEEQEIQDNRIENDRNLAFRLDVIETSQLEEQEGSLFEENVTKSQVESTPLDENSSKQKFQSEKLKEPLHQNHKPFENQKQPSPKIIKNEFENNEESEMYIGPPKLDLSQLPPQQRFIKNSQTLFEAAENGSVDEIIDNVMEIVIEVISDITAVELIILAEIELEEGDLETNRRSTRMQFGPVLDDEEAWDTISNKMELKMKEYLIKEANEIRRNASFAPNALQMNTVDAMVNAILKGSLSQRRLTL